MKKVKVHSFLRREKKVSGKVVSEGVIVKTVGGFMSGSSQVHIPSWMWEDAEINRGDRVLLKVVRNSIVISKERK